ALGTDPGSSWRSETPEDQTSPSPSSCATPNSATDVPDAELTFTVGVTEGTPYACQFCDKAFPRLSYLKKHEQEQHLENFIFLLCLYTQTSFQVFSLVWKVVEEDANKFIKAYFKLLVKFKWGYLNHLCYEVIS
ncbi:hypothetical protein L9F63_028174, partial [Diploptera punctata]